MASSGRSSGPIVERAASKHQKRKARQEKTVVKSEDINGYRGNESIDDILKFINGSGNANTNKKKEIKEASNDADVKAGAKKKNNPKPSHTEPKPETAQ